MELTKLELIEIVKMRLYRLRSVYHELEIKDALDKLDIVISELKEKLLHK